jgi:hypothetical protein
MKYSIQGIKYISEKEEIHCIIYSIKCFTIRGSHGCDRMVVGFTITSTINAYYHLKGHYLPKS